VTNPVTPSPDPTREERLRQAYHICDDALREVRDRIPPEDFQTRMIIDRALTKALHTTDAWIDS
jgi:hypothetical protein